jgi:hypothetical protein
MSPVANDTPEETSAKCGELRSAEHCSASLAGVSGGAMLRAPINSIVEPGGKPVIAA